MAEGTREEKNSQDIRSNIESRIIRSPKGQLEFTLKRLRRIAHENSSVLFVGPTGTGKELLADYVVEQSPRKEGPYHKINCIGLPENIIESELFGHAKGAFTGAIGDKVGLIETSNGGTLFLDEIGALPETTQVKLLRVLEDKRIRKVGETSSKEVDVRFLAATNRDLIIDLRYRFQFSIETLSLSNRPEDLPHLLQHLLTGTAFESIALGALFSIAFSEWEGNVRQLINFLKDAEITQNTYLDESHVSDPHPAHSPLTMFRPEKSENHILEWYWMIRNHTDFDEVMLRENPIHKIGLEWHPKMSQWFRDELCLPLSSNFPEITTRIIERFHDLFIKSIYKPYATTITTLQKEARLLEPEAYRKAGIRLKEELPQSGDKKEDGKISDFPFSDLPLKQAQEGFRKTYWTEIHGKNPGLTNMELATKMGITKQSYQKMKKKFTLPKDNLPEIDKR